MKNLSVKRMTTSQEREVAIDLRQKYFFDRAQVRDPYLWTFDDQEHVHLVLYQGSDIVGYAHVQLWPDARAAIRIIVVDEKFRKKGLGKTLLIACEKMIRENGVRVLQAEAHPDSLLFYKSLGYFEMPFNDPAGELTHPNDIAVGKMLNLF